MKTKMTINLVLIISVFMGYAASGVSSLKLPADSRDVSYRPEELAVVEPGNKSFRSGSSSPQDGRDVFYFGNFAYDLTKMTKEEMEDPLLQSHVAGANERRQEVDDTDHLQTQWGQEVPVKSFRVEADPGKVDEDEEEVKNWRKLATITMADEGVMTELPVKSFRVEADPEKVDEEEVEKLATTTTADEGVVTELPVKSFRVEADLERVDEGEVQNLKTVATTITPNELTVTDPPIQSFRVTADPEKVDEEEVQNLRKLVTPNTPDLPNTDAMETATIHYGVTDNEFISRPHDISGLNAPSRREDPSNLKAELPPGRVLQYLLFVSKKVYDLWWTQGGS